MKINKLFKNILSILIIITFLTVASGGTFFLMEIKDLKINDFQALKEKKYSYIEDSSSRIVEDFSTSSYKMIPYSKLPPILIKALLSIEDNEFFYHNGINPKRIFLAFLNNLDKSKWKIGGSTLTQQLVKNTFLSQERTYKRKIKEAYLSLLLEKKMSKEEILENFFNRIYFDESIQGIGYASNHFFSKDVCELNYIECAVLVGLIKSPSQYHPLKHKEKCNERKNVVLKSMLKNNVITLNEYNKGININLENLLKINEKEDSYPYQAYLDLVYEEVKELTSFDPFIHPLKIETYLDTTCQSYIDKIQNGTEFNFSTSSLQIGGAVIDNKSGGVVGIIGGRNYIGKKLFNHAYALKASPASTIKPLLSYALGIKDLNYHSLTTLKDEPLTYPTQNIIIHNADSKYLNDISLIEAIGYSRNTCAVSSLNSILSLKGEDYIIDYLKSINLWDEGYFSLSYALGGFTYGVSPLNLASAYSLIPRLGLYKKASTIKKITDLETGKVIYIDKQETKRILSEEDATILLDTLLKVISSNLINENDVSPSFVKIGGKTGTNAYDAYTINKYDYPLSSNKDIWFCGFSPSYTISIWEGFDYHSKEEKTYFYSKDERRKYPKQIFKKIMERISPKYETFTYSHNVDEKIIIKGEEKNYYPSSLVPLSYRGKTLVKKETLIEELPPLNFTNIDEVNINLTGEDITFNVLTPLNINKEYNVFLGEDTFYLDIKSEGNNITIPFKNSITYRINKNENYVFSIYHSFLNSTIEKGEPFVYEKKKATFIF